MNSNLLRLTPLLTLLLLSLALAMGLFRMEPRGLNNDLVGTRLVAIDLPMLNNANERFSPRLWKGKVVVLNVFASWCVPCAAEQPELIKLAQTNQISLYGLAWKDNSESINKWLLTRGNPYLAIGIDSSGLTRLVLALTGVPETFIIDRKGVIAWHYREPLTADIINRVVIPLVAKLNSGELG